MVFKFWWRPKPCTWIVDLKGRDIRINVLSLGHIVTPAFPI